MLGSACTHKILVDGEAIFGIRAGEFQALYLVPGEHTFELEIEAGICLAHSVGRSIVLSNAAETTYRIFIPSTFSMPRLETNDPLNGGTDHLPTGPTFTWDHRYSTPEAALIITEKNRVATARGTEVSYEFTARGFPTGVPAILWLKHLNSYSQLDAKVREDGVVMVIGTPTFGISGYVAGEAVDLALVLGDSRAHAKTFPFPIAAKKGDYSATVELMSDTGLLFQVTFAGLQNFDGSDPLDFVSWGPPDFVSSDPPDFGDWVPPAGRVLRRPRRSPEWSTDADVRVQMPICRGT